MNPESFTNMVSNVDKNKYAQFIQRRLQSMQSRNNNWKMSYTFVKTAQKNVVLRHKTNILLYSYKSKLKDVCPAQIQALKQHIQKDLEPKYDESKSTDIDFDEEEKEEDLDVHPSELTVEVPKLKTWDMYKQLVEESRLRPKVKYIPEQPVIDVSTLSKIYFEYRIKKFIISRIVVKKKPQKSIIKLKKERILVANKNYVEFKNFELKKVYKKIITIKNIGNMPVRYHLRKQPYHSKFWIMIKPVIENKNIIPPGLTVQLIIFFRCDEIDTPDEILIIKVQYGSPLVIRMCGYKDSPHLVGTKSYQ